MSHPDMPESSSRYTVPREDADVRPGETAPWRDEGDLPKIGQNLHSVMEATRNLFQVARNPRNDPLWRHLRPLLQSWERELSIGSSCSPDLLTEIRRYLCHPAPAPGPVAERPREISQDAARKLLIVAKESRQRIANMGYTTGVWISRLDAAITHAMADLGPDPVCEHGIKEGDYCELCNQEYKRARADLGEEPRS